MPCSRPHRDSLSLAIAGEARCAGEACALPGMRSFEVIESELRLLAAFRRTAAEVSAPASRTEPVDQLLDQWLAAHRLGYQPRRIPLGDLGELAYGRKYFVGHSD